MADEFEAVSADEAIAEFQMTMNGRQYLILAEAIRQLGGELRIRPEDFAAAANQPKKGMDVDGTEGEVLLRRTERS